MADQSRLNYGMEKLNKALDALEASLNELDNKKKNEKTKVLDAKTLKSENAKLAKELEQVKARSVVLEDANNEVSERLETAVENISDVLRAV